MNHAMVFANREVAGKALAEKLAARKFEDPVILALPRGGVPVGAEIAKALNAPLDIVLVRKIGVPFQPELAMAAVVDGDHPDLVINEDVRRMAGVSDEELREAEKRQLEEIGRRRELYLKGRERPSITGATAIVVDDGIATGATVRAALKALRRRKPKKLVLAVAVAPQDTVDRLKEEVDELICLTIPEPFYAIGLYYRDFSQVGDAEVIALLEQYGWHRDAKV
ncbi:MAG: phosphoribosyltransferase, partial [Alphaproteobacteria bacterium]